MALPSLRIATRRICKQLAPRCFYHNTHKFDRNTKNGIVVDLRSDVLSIPPEAMLDSMRKATLGDDVYREDPTMLEFERRFAEYCGMESALFVSSGTLGNLLCVMAHCETRGSELLIGHLAHVFRFEQAGIAQLGGIQAHQVPNNPDGTFDIADMVSRIQPDDIHCPNTKLVCLESTHNMCGGRAVPLEWIDEVGQVSHSHGLPVHVDGARLVNAAVAQGHSVARLLKECDSTSICFSKGLGTPIGTGIAGSKELIQKCIRLRKAMGGGMRQTGLLAASAIYALDNMVDRLADDHRRIKEIVKGIDESNRNLLRGNEDEVETNIAILYTDNDRILPAQLCERLAQVTDEDVAALGERIEVRAFPWTKDSIRLVSHCGVDDLQTEAAIKKINFVLRQLKQ